MSMNERIAEKYAVHFERLLQLQVKIKPIHVLLERHYPIAIAEDGYIGIFDYDVSQGKYDLKVCTPDTIGIIPGVRAAFPLECYDNKACVVVSGDIFDSLEEQLIIFHEFVHCYQFETCEMEVREELELARNAVNTSDYYWELQYPFPYQDAEVAACLNLLFSSYEENRWDDIVAIRKRLQAYLTGEQYEYMVWQEWKEGFARFIENQIKVYVGITPNHGGTASPYSRTTFYASGSRMIDLLIRSAPEMANDLKTLFRKLRNPA